LQSLQSLSLITYHQKRVTEVTLFFVFEDRISV